MTDNGQLQFRISRALRGKPGAGSSGASVESRVPGSDINVDSLDVQTLNSTHRLVFNKFAVYRPHLMILTENGFRRQWEPLDVDDFGAVSEFMKSTADAKYLILFNGGVAAGCSRLHKHMQAMPIADLDPWTNVGVMHFEAFEQKWDELPQPEELAQIYTDLLHQAAQSMGWHPTTDNEAPAHSVLMDDGRMMVIPRRNAAYENLGVNACGMLGILWVSSEDLVDDWLQVGPRKILETTGVPKK